MSHFLLLEFKGAVHSDDLTANPPRAPALQERGTGPPVLPDDVDTLPQNEQAWADFFEHAPIGLHWADPQGRVLKVNRAELDMLGYTPDEYLDRVAADFHQNPDIMRAALDQLARGQSVNTFASRLRCKDGSFKDVLIALNALRHHGALLQARCFTTDITPLKREETLSATLNAQLIEAARLAGMEEVASSVLHNVGNVLNSVNVSAMTAVQRLTHSRLAGLAQVAELVRSHAGDLAAFVTTDPRGRKLPNYLDTLAKYWNDEQALLLRELRRLTHSLDHIKDVVSRQQSLTGVSSQAESASISELIEDALTLAVSGPERLGLTIQREFTIDFSLYVERKKFMLILVNLLHNAKDALLASETRNKQITVRTELLQEGAVCVDVIDNGVGITPENLARVPSRGFTTKKGGHGFGLHSSALAAREMGGCLSIHSDGPGQGARFTLKIPLAPGRKKEEPS